MSDSLNTKPVLNPEVISETSDTNGYRLTLRVPRELSYFEGHFDQAKILPGVVQIEWVVKLASERFDIVGEFKQLEVIKFQHVIVPENTLNLDLSYLVAKNKIIFKYSLGEKPASSGRILFGVGNGV
ncbi:MAG: hypothetical protein MI867_01050 [Pseudomonadales bacterium]|nr:hypothetical protein [Pseudomonadales bacterium]